MTAPASKTALIIGASRGLGYALAAEYLARGWQVTATVRGAGWTGLHDLARSSDGRLVVETVDITVPEQVAALHERLAQATFDLLFVNAGVTNGPGETVADVSTDTFVRLMVTNALSPMRVVETLQDLVAPNGTIAVMSSGQGSVANNDKGGFEVYRASKSALNQLMRSFAARHADDPRTLLLMAPGWVQTDLGGPAARLTTGQSIPGVADTIEAQAAKGGLQYLDYQGKTVRWWRMRSATDGLEDINVKIIAIEEHWNSVNIRDALDRLQNGARDESVAFNTMGDNQARLEDIGQGRVEAMDAAGIDVSILSVVTPATQALPAREAIALAREANDEATDAVRAHPARFRAFATLPTSDPQAAAAELERCATRLGHVGAMIHGRTGTRTLDDPAYDDLFATAARLHQPIFIHPQIPSNELRDAAYRGLDPLIDLGLASFGWGWHMDAGLSALRLILRGTFDRYPDLQLILGHWGEMLLFWMDRADSLSAIAKHLERRVSDYITTNIHITSSGMLQERLLRHALDFTGADRVLFSTDYPFHRPGAAAAGQFFDAIPDPSDRSKIASGNAKALFRLAWPDAPGR